jgi:hypothetical protein
MMIDSPLPSVEDVTEQFAEFQRQQQQMMMMTQAVSSSQQQQQKSKMTMIDQTIDNPKTSESITLDADNDDNDEHVTQQQQESQHATEPADEEVETTLSTATQPTLDESATPAIVDERSQHDSEAMPRREALEHHLRTALAHTPRQASPLAAAMTPPQSPPAAATAVADYQPSTQIVITRHQYLTRHRQHVVVVVHRPSCWRAAKRCARRRRISATMPNARRATPNWLLNAMPSSGFVSLPLNEYARY